jgi:hypothetical protein
MKALITLALVAVQPSYLTECPPVARFYLSAIQERDTVLKAYQRCVDDSDEKRTCSVEFQRVATAQRHVEIMADKWKQTCPRD